MSYNYITKHNSPNYTPASQAQRVWGMPRKVEGITIHHWGDPNQNPQFQNIVNYLCRSGGNTSAHYVATGTNRQVACIVSPDDGAWHGGTAWSNARTIGIELDPRARDEDYDVAAELVADIRSAYGDVPIYWHSYFVATACPGRWSPERLDELSYTKYSHATEWGKGGDKVKPPVVQPEPPKSLYRLIVDGKQVAAYSTEQNAYNGYVQYGSKGSITLDGKAVTKEIIEKFKPSETTKDPETGNTLPDTGEPITSKEDYGEENNGLLKEILAIVKAIMSLLTGIFKGK